MVRVLRAWWYRNGAAFAAAVFVVLALAGMLGGHAKAAHGAANLSSFGVLCAPGGENGTGTAIDHCDHCVLGSQRDGIDPPALAVGEAAFVPMPVLARFEALRHVDRPIQSGLVLTRLPPSRGPPTFS